MGRSRRLSQLFNEDGFVSIIGCHDALTAALTEKMGGRAIWASGLGISLTHGKNDANELSHTQLEGVIEHMADFTEAPILVDADTGFGDFNNARMFAKKMVRVGAAGIALEDKKFPKSNSFSGEAQPLEDMYSFTDKLKAVRDTVGDDLFVVGRLEGFISGQPLHDTLTRAYTYAGAGVDALIVHSKKEDASEIRSFAAAWNHSTPVIIIPTTYSDDVPRELFGSTVKGVIWANQLLRSYVTNMAHALKSIIDNDGVVQLEQSIASVKDILHLAGTDKLKEDRKLYAGNPPAPALEIVMR